MSAVWRKSSRSNAGGNANCVEVSLWRKSSRSNNGGNANCVEVALIGVVAAVRDSKNPAGPTISLPDWSGFLAAAKNGAYDR